MADTRFQKLAATVTTTIPVTCRRVFDYLSRLENNPQWNWAVTATTPLTPGSVGPGSRFLQASTAEPAHTRTLEVTGMEAPHLLEVVAAGKGLSAIYRYELEAADRHTTRLRLYAGVEPHHPVGRADLYVERLEASLDAGLDSLRSVLTPAGERRPRRDDH